MKSHSGEAENQCPRQANTASEAGEQKEEGPLQAGHTNKPHALTAQDQKGEE